MNNRKHIIGISTAVKTIGVLKNPGIPGITGYISLPLTAVSNFGGSASLLDNDDNFSSLINFTGQSGTAGAADIHPDRELVAFCRNGSSGTMRVIRDLFTPNDILYSASLTSPGLGFSEDYAFFGTHQNLVRISLDTFESATLLTDTSFGVVNERSRIDVHKDGWLVWVLGDSSAGILRKVDFDGQVIHSFTGVSRSSSVAVSPNGVVYYSRFVTSPNRTRIVARENNAGMTVRWSRDFETGSASLRGSNFLAVMPDNSLIYARAGDAGFRGLYELDPTDGSTIWHNPDYSVTACGVDRSGHIYVSTEGADPTPNRLLKFDRTGNLLQQVQFSTHKHVINPHPGRTGMFHP